MLDLLHITIEDILNDAISICLISDIWTNMLDFLGLAANLINSKFEKKTLVIGMMLMPGAHNAENIALAITTLINRYKSLDKTKIHGKY